MIPWKEISATIGKVFILTQEMQKDKADIKSLSEPESWVEIAMVSPTATISSIGSRNLFRYLRVSLLFALKAKLTFR